MIYEKITKTLLLFWKEEDNPKFKSQNMPSSLQLHRINPTNPTTNPSNSSSCHKKSQQPEFATPEIFIPLQSLSLVPDHVAVYHSHMILPNQCSSSVVQTIEAPVSTVWSIIRRFDKPQVYKHFLKSCHVIVGNGDVGTVREVHVVSGLPAGSSMERLEILDDERHTMSFSIVGGDHRLVNYRSVTTLHATACGGKTVVVESYVVDIPSGNTWDDTCVFLDTIVRCNLQSLAQICQSMAKGNTEENRQ